MGEAADMRNRYLQRETDCSRQNDLITLSAPGSPWAFGFGASPGVVSHCLLIAGLQ